MRILIIEDQNLIGKALKKGLVEEGYAVDWVTNLVDGLHLCREIEYDTMVLDIMLPDGSGLDLLKELRTANLQTPVIILSAKDTLADKSLGFRMGTDDYMTKPFAFEEVLLRIAALIRRKYQVYGQSMSVGDLELDLSARVARVGDKVLRLTSKEFSILELFVLKRTKILSRAKIAEHIYSDSAEQESNVIDVFINKLRRKLETAGLPPLIETIRGEGYTIR
ncbi:MAG: response regulator transcription factor [Proteobacteria bacterium]|nr:MAG: response regulator transcription factor [Pseudomonadota bacterium]